MTNSTINIEHAELRSLNEADLDIVVGGVTINIWSDYQAQQIAQQNKAPGTVGGSLDDSRPFLVTTP